jgi:hypothetical protein
LSSNEINKLNAPGGLYLDGKRPQALFRRVAHACAGRNCTYTCRNSTLAAPIGSGCSRTGAAPGESSVARVSCFCEQACHPQAAVLRRLQLHLMLCRLPPSYSRTKTASLARPCAFLSRSTSKSPHRSSSFLSPCDFSFREATHRLLHPSTPRSPSGHSTAHAPWPPHSSLSPLALSCAAAFLSLCALPLLRLVVECLCEIRVINKTFARCTQT